jgi:hypothetical protein
VHHAEQRPNRSALQGASPAASREPIYVPVHLVCNREEL